MDSHDKKPSLVTERDIDPEFGLFEDEPYVTASAEDELLAMYPHHNVHSANGQEQDLDITVDQAMTETSPDEALNASETPIDPAAPEEQFHGTDLLNGV